MDSYLKNTQNLTTYNIINDFMHSGLKITYTHFQNQNVVTNTYVYEVSTVHQTQHLGTQMPMVCDLLKRGRNDKYEPE